MPRSGSSFGRVLVIGAGAAGLMAARELARAGKRVTVLEARDRCGGRIYPLPAEEFGYPAEGGAEFVHGAAPVTRAVMRQAGLSLSPRRGTRWSTRSGALARANQSLPYAGRFCRALAEVTADLTVAEFLDTRFAGPEYEALRRSITRTVEGYDAADPCRMSILAFREEWMARDDGEHGRIAGGYGALTAYLAAEARSHGATLLFGAEVAALEESRAGILARCRGGAVFEADAAVLTVPVPLLSEIALPSAAQDRAARAAADIGYGNVVKILLRFTSKWWGDIGKLDLSDLSFLISDAAVPTWWTQFPDDHSTLTGWFAGPRTQKVSSLTESELVEMGLASLAEIFDPPLDALRSGVAAARAINWGNDPFARGAYSYATPRTRAALAELSRPEGAIFFSGEALYAGPDMGTVEAALASGQATARTLIAAGP